MLVSNVLTLCSVDTQHFVNDVALSCLSSLQAHQVMKIQRTDSQAITCYDFVILLDRQLCSTRNLISNWCAGVSCQDNRVFSNFNHTVKCCNQWLSIVLSSCENITDLYITTGLDNHRAALERDALDVTRSWRDLNDILFAIFPKVNRTCRLGDKCLALWLTSLKQLFNTRKTLRNVTTSHTRVVEGSECQLCTRFTDRLSGNHTDRLCVIDQLACCHINTVTSAWNTTKILGRKDRLNFDIIDTVISFNRIRDFTRNEFVLLYKASNILGRIATKESVSKVDHRLFRL